MKNKFIERKWKNEELENKEIKSFKLKSEYYNHDNELLNKRDNNSKDKLMWLIVLGFILFFILLILIILFTR